MLHLLNKWQKAIYETTGAISRQMEDAQEAYMAQREQGRWWNM